MRLICPNCDAQYEVDDNAIPESGRDVQCSDCGHAWFQLSPEAEMALLAAEEEERIAPPVVAPPAPVAAAAPAPLPPEEPDLPAPPPQPDAPRRALDDNLVALLREEAEREAAQRRTEDTRIADPQPEAPRAAEPRRSPATAPVVEPEPVVAPRAAQRRDLLPDIEEINSTLRASSEPRPDGGHALAPPPSRAAFRSGFVLMMVLAVALVTTYVMSPRLAQQFPGAAPALAAYVEGANQARLWLDGWMQLAVQALNGDGS